MADQTGVMMARTEAKVVLDYLAQRKAVPFFELLSLVPISENQMHVIVDGLEKENYVRVSDKGTLDEIVAIREQGIRAAG